MEFFKTAGLYRKDLASGKEGFTMSALLLFGKNEIIQSAIPHYKIDALVRKENIGRYDDRDNIRCNLIEAYDRLMAFVAKHLPDKFYLQGDQRISLRDMIFREIIANILIHREYTNAFPSTFIIYNDRVETKNANRPHLHQILKPGNFEPYPKNPHIAQIFTQMGRSEELGTGVNNVFRYSQNYSGSNNIIFKEEDTFVSIIPLKRESHGELNGELSNRQKQVLETIKSKPGISAKLISEKLSIPFSTIDKYIRLFLKNKLIERRGSKKTGGYHAI